MSIDPLVHVATLVVFLAGGALSGCGGRAERRVFRDLALPAVVAVPGESGLIYQVAAVPGGPRACRLFALDGAGEVLGHDDESGPLGLPELDAPAGTRALRIVPVDADTPVRSRRVHLYVNDPGADRDGDGLGAQLEHALGTCDAADDPGCARSLLAEYYRRVPRATRDSDRDGLSDGDELFGVAHEPLLDLPRFGADPRHKDVFVEVDHNKRVEPPGVLESDLVAIRALFARGSAASLRNPDQLPGIAVHFDVGFEPKDPALADLFGAWGGSGLSHGDYKVARRQDFSKARAHFFRYAVLTRGGIGQSSGDALGINRDLNRVTLLAHELAHTLGLKHEGHPSWGAYNCKPNHRSIINYAYQNDVEVGFSRQARPSLNPLHVQERVRTERALAERLRKPPFELDADEHGVDWNRDGVLSSEPVRAGITWATYKSCMAATAGQAVLAESARAATPALVGGEGEVHVLWIDEGGGLMHRAVTPALRCAGSRCAKLSEPVAIEGLGELEQIAATQLDDGTVALAHTDRAGQLSVSTLEPQGEGFRVTGTERVLGAVTHGPPAIARSDDRTGLMLLFRAEDGGLAEVRASAPLASFELAHALDSSARAIAIGQGPSLLALPAGELCGVFPDAESFMRFHCYERASNAWRDLSAQAFYATLGPKTGGPVGMAYHRFRYADGRLIDPSRGAVYLSFTEPAPGVKAADNPIVLMSRALGAGVLARDAIDFRWRGSLLNQWAHVAAGGSVALYEDASLPGLIAVMPARRSDKDAPKTSARLDVFPAADGVFDAELGAGDDFAVMERGICTTLRGAKACGGPSTAAY